jgi:hypothetical protein
MTPGIALILGGVLWAAAVLWLEISFRRIGRDK